MNKKKKWMIIGLIIMIISVDLILTYTTNLQINESIKQSIPKYIPHCDKTPYYRGDLRECNFQNAYLKDANLIGMDFQSANLRGANLQGSNLKGVNLQVADLSGADLSGADLEYAYLYRANLTGANLTGANFYNSHLPGVDLSMAIIRHTNFTGATFHVDGLEEALNSARAQAVAKCHDKSCL